MKIYEIIPRLVYQRGAFEKMPLANKVKFLHSWQIRAVVNLCPRLDGEIAAGGEFDYYHATVPDSANASFADVERAAHFAYDHCKRNRAVLIHCNAGRNRSSLVSAILLMELRNYTGAEAVEYMRQKRPNALATPAFVDYLQARGRGLFYRPDFP